MKRCFSLLLCGFLAGCAMPNKPYWVSDWKRNPQAVEPAQVDPKRFSSRLAVVELDEQGDLWGGHQLETARKMVHDSPKRPLLVIYIHGWQTNAHPRNRDLQTFSNFIAKLEAAPEVKDNFTVTGVFIGWRGASFTSESSFTGIGYVARQASFWSRLDATNRVAGVPLTGAIAQLVSAARSCPSDRGVSMLIGYSFGGRILERTLGQALVSQHAYSSDQDGALLPADLTILINPASESLYARQLKLAMKNWKSPHPAIISLTSESDLVTAVAWPAANWISNVFGGFRKYVRQGTRESQKSFVVSTAGHDPRMPTHAFVYEGPATVPDGRSAFEYNADKATAKRFYVSQPNGTSAYGLETLPGGRPGALPTGGYWVLHVPSEILKGHGGIFEEGGIFSEQVTDVLAALYSITNTDEIRSTQRVELNTSR
ncbi:MAG: hypothetical protein BGO12_10410 [Verrucomicrobia bacterium 61-8]|nr:hypothetical protein [Verrucomicrobiota bacterium]OJV26188.1 MAG: hypothetical protein BGO12_10410 [Verrucomicrobia bacterium 61-8]